jgi:hypothetical protein
MVSVTLKVWQVSVTLVLDWQVSVTLVLDYLLMLIAMTFNVGLFAAVILGVGNLLIRKIDSYGKMSPSCHAIFPK